MATLIATALPTASDITVVKNGSDTGSSPAPEKLANTVTVNEVQDSCSPVDELQYKIVTVRKADGSIGKVRKLITPAATETSSTPAAPFSPQPVALPLQVATPQAPVQPATTPATAPTPTVISANDSAYIAAMTEKDKLATSTPAPAANKITTSPSPAPTTYALAASPAEPLASTTLGNQALNALGSFNISHLTANLATASVAMQQAQAIANGDFGTATKLGKALTAPAPAAPAATTPGSPLSPEVFVITLGNASLRRLR